MKALLLDLDDTLLDYSGGADECWSAACLSLGPAAGIDPERLVAAVARARIWFWSDPGRHRRERVNMLRAWERIVAHALAEAGLEADGLAAEVAGDFAARRRAAMGLFPDALDCLERLRRRGVPLALVTNGDASQQRDKIDRHGLAGYFEAIVIEGEFGAGKPDEAVYRHALAALGADPGEAWMVGDHIEFDVAGPQRLGLRGIWLDRTGQGLPGESPVQPYRIIRSLRELVDPVATPPPTSRRRS
jgi:putative hydrolase of the HAD superfamily